MKKLFLCILICILLVFGLGAASKAYTFMNIPWGTELSDLKPILSDLGFLDFYESEYTALLDWNFKSKIYLSNELPYTEVGKDVKCYSFKDGFNIAGYEVDKIETSFLFSHDSKTVDKSKSELVQVCIDFKVFNPYDVFSDLKAKLSSLYGTPASYKQNDSIMAEECAVWLGSDNTGIALIMAVNARNSNFFSVNLYYGKTNGDSLIADIKKVLSNQAVSNAQGNFFGL